MKKILFKGCGTAIVTPFTEKGINFPEFEKLIEFQIENNVDAIIVCGTTGESSTMTMSEKKSLIKFAVDISDKRVPIIAGTGGNCTKDVIHLSKYAEKVGCDGLLIVTPYYNKTTAEGLYNHYYTIAKSTKLPIILYNVPSRTGVNISPDIVFRLSKTENIIGIKEASGNISAVAEISSLCSNNLYIYSGCDDQILPVLSLGGIGVISVVSNILPKQIHNMVHYYLNGNTSNALNIQMCILPLINILFSEVNPIPIKTALELIGYDTKILRLPLVPMTEIGRRNLEKELKKIMYKL